MRTATEVLHRVAATCGEQMVLCHGEVPWMNQATCCRAHFGPKSAPQHRDFGPGKVGVS